MSETVKPGPEVADKGAEWNRALDDEIQDAAGKLYGEEMGVGVEIQWNETQQSFTSADWAEVRRCASEMLANQ